MRATRWPWVPRSLMPTSGRQLARHRRRSTASSDRARPALRVSVARDRGLPLASSPGVGTGLQLWSGEHCPRSCAMAARPAPRWHVAPARCSLHLSQAAACVLVGTATMRADTPADWRPTSTAAVLRLFFVDSLLNTASSNFCRGHRRQSAPGAGGALHSSRLALQLELELVDHRLQAVALLVDGVGEMLRRLRPSAWWPAGLTHIVLDGRRARLRNGFLSPPRTASSLMMW